MSTISTQDVMSGFSTDSQFEMLLVAAARAKMLQNGSRPLVPRGNSDWAVLALREIEAGFGADDFLGQHNEENDNVVEDQ